MMDFADIEDIALRLLVAVLAGAALGFNRELRGKSIGVRTLAIVALGSALSVMAVGSAENIDAASRVIQGLLTGIGFLGAGVIIRPRGKGEVEGLTTAACTWSSAANAPNPSGSSAMAPSYRHLRACARICIVCACAHIFQSELTPEAPA